MKEKKISQALFLNMKPFSVQMACLLGNQNKIQALQKVFQRLLIKYTAAENICCNTIRAVHIKPKDITNFLGKSSCVFLKIRIYVQ